MKLITAKEAGELLGVTEHAIYKYKSQGKLPCYTIGSGLKAPLRFKKQDVLKLLLKNKICPVIKTIYTNKTKQDKNIITSDIYNQVIEEFYNKAQ